MTGAFPGGKRGTLEAYRDVVRRCGSLEELAEHDAYDGEGLRFDCVPADILELGAAIPSGVGIATGIDHLHQSFRTAVVALRLCSPPEVTSVGADEYGGLIGLLADMPSDAHVPDVDLLESVMSHAWACSTVDALIRSGTLRQAARHAGVHHSPLQTRVDTVTGMIGFDPLDGLGRTRLGIAYLVWRLRHSRVLDLPAPTANLAAAGGAS